MGFNQTSGFTQRVAEVVTSLRPIEMRANMNKEKIVESKIGLHIKQLRKAQRITQKDLAAEIGTIEQTISKIERGVFTLSVETIMQFCNALNVTPNELRIDNPRCKNGILIDSSIKNIHSMVWLTRLHLYRTSLQSRNSFMMTVMIRKNALIWMILFKCMLGRQMIHWPLLNSSTDDTSTSIWMRCREKFKCR